ncbi:hypothetical protein DFJ73DRAFT_849903 [Zopfochytrium polystomum]|nr:hypothetical protein DFJ73DRAFT_849903 [Zopfochytrium polystomum]
MILGLFEEIRSLGRCLCSTIFFCVCVGPISMIVGIIFLVLSTNHERERAIDDYTAVVTDWTSTYASTFLGANFTYLPGGSSPAALGMVTTGQDYQGVIDPDKSGVPKYAQTFYASTAVVSTSPTKSYVVAAVSPAGVASNLTISAATMPEYTSGTSTKDKLGCRASGDCNAYSGNDLTRCLQKPDCGSVCAALMGVMLGDTCTYPVVLDSICIRVRDSASGYVLDVSNPRYSNIGCFYEGRFLPGVYIPLVKSSVYYRFSVSDFQRGKYEIPNGVIVRESHDPLIFLSWQTGGEYDFGLSTQKKLAIGLSALIGGALITVVVITAVWCILRFFCKKVNAGNPPPSSGPQIMYQQPQTNVYMQSAGPQAAYGPSSMGVFVQPAYTQPDYSGASYPLQHPGPGYAPLQPGYAPQPGFVQQPLYPQSPQGFAPPSPHLPLPPQGAYQQQEPHYVGYHPATGSSPPSPNGAAPPYSSLDYSGPQPPYGYGQHGANYILPPKSEKS